MLKCKFTFLNQGDVISVDEVTCYYSEKEFINNRDLIKVIKDNFQIDISDYELSEFAIKIADIKDSLSFTIHLKKDDHDKIRDFKLRKILEKTQL